MAILAFMPIIGQLLDRIIPDTTKAAEAKAELEKMALSGELQTVLAQLDINKVEAANPNTFVSGWRPGAGWVCVFSLGYNYILQPFLVFALEVLGRHVAAPELSMEGLMTILAALLGLGTMRSVEVVKGAKPPGS